MRNAGLLDSLKQLHIATSTLGPNPAAGAGITCAEAVQLPDGEANAGLTPKLDSARQHHIAHVP